MAKSIFKIVYVALGVIIAFLVYLVGYNSNGYNHIQSLTAAAIEQKDYAEVAMIHGGCFEKNNLVTEDSDLLDLVIYPSTTLSTNSYYASESEDAEVKTVNSYDNSYYIYIFDANFQTTDLSANGVLNSTGVRFKTVDGSYDYDFKVGADVNSDVYVKKPTSVKNVLLNSERNLFENYINWGFFNLTLTSSMIDAMQESLKGDITSLGIIDSEGEEVFSIDVNLDFSQTFFEDVKPLVDNYNIYIDDVNAAEANDDKDALKAAEAKFDEFYLSTDDKKGFEETFVENTNYTFRHDDKYLQPAKIVWQTIGMLVIYLIIVALIYMLLFHFNFLKGLISRARGNNNYAYKGNKNNVINAKTTEVKSNDQKNKSQKNNKTVTSKGEEVKPESLKEVKPVEVEEPKNTEVSKPENVNPDETIDVDIIEEEKNN